MAKVEQYVEAAQPADENDVIVHTSDPTKYFKRGSTTVLPRAQKDGRSQGFQLKPTVINVIDMSENADHTMGLASPVVQVDMGAFDKRTLKKVAAESDVNDPMQVFVNLSKQAKPEVAPRQVAAEPAKVAPGFSISAPMAPGSAPPPAYVVPTVSVDQPPRDYGMIQEQLSALTTAVTHLITKSNATDMEVAEKQQEVADPAAIVNEFTSELGLGYLTYEPSRPKVKVYFDLGGTYGQLAVCYHDVQVYGGCMLFTYDTRYEGGMQYVPPKTQDGEFLKISIPSTSKRYLASSFDLKFTDGPLDRFLLIVKPENKEEDDNNG